MPPSMDGPRAPRGPRANGARPAALAALGLWLGLGLGTARAAVAFAIDHLAHGIAAGTSLWRVDRRLGATLAAALAVGLLAAFLLGRTRGALRAACGALSALLAFAVLAGVGVDLPSRVPGMQEPRGQAALGVLAVAGVAVALAAARLARRPPGWLAARTASVAALVAALALWLLPGALGVGPSPMRLREVARALLEEPGALEVVSANPRLVPEVGAITPSMHWRSRGGERPALVMAPGSEVRFEVRPEDGPVRLRTAVACDRELRVTRKRGWERIHFDFEVLVDGEEVFRHRLLVEHGGDDLDYPWVPVGGEEGIPLRPGNVVVLRTSAEAPVDQPGLARAPWRIGFADLLLERERFRERERSSPEHPNIVLVLMDTLRSDRLGCYGYERGLTPRLDRLAARGVLYEQGLATSSWTWPSTASVLTGLEPETHGVVDDLSCHVARNVELLSEALQREGYTTAAFSASPLIVPAKSFDQGFEFFDHDESGFRRSQLVVPPAVEWIQTYAGQRFFLYVHLVDPHDPHLPRPEDAERFAGDAPADLAVDAFSDYNWRLRRGEAWSEDGGTFDLAQVVPVEHQRYLDALYDACVATGDHWVGELLDGIEAAGLTGETVVAFTSDHGEEFFEHGMLEHGHTLFPELVDVPLILAGPGVPRGVRSDVPVSNRHLAPTLARIGGARMEAVADALDLTRPAELPLEPVVHTTRYGWWNKWHRTPIHALRTGRWKLHWAPEAGEWGAEDPTPGGLWRLYDVGSDRGEGTDVSALEPELARELRAELERRMEQQVEERTAPAIGGAGTRDLLQGIGYLESDG